MRNFTWAPPSETPATIDVRIQHLGGELRGVSTLGFREELRGQVLLDHQVEHRIYHVLALRISDLLHGPPGHVGAFRPAQMRPAGRPCTFTTYDFMRSPSALRHLPPSFSY